MDECHFQQHGSRLAAWFPWDEKDPVVKHAPVRHKVGIIGAVRANDGTLITVEEEKFNAQSTEAFLAELIKHRDGDKVMIVVLDNARFHHSRVLLPWLEKHSECLRLDYLPPYSPDLNSIERVWKFTRRLCTHNRYFATLDETRQAVSAKFAEWACPNSILAQLCAAN